MTLAARRNVRRGRSIACLLVALVLACACGHGAGAPQELPAAAPENLRCPGRPAPALPGPGWQAQAVWGWQDFMRVEGVVGSSDGPHAVAIDRGCNSYVADSEHFQIIKLSSDGTVLGRWPMPGVRASGESSSPRGVAVDAQGNVYASDYPRDRVYKFSPQGQVVATLGDCPGGQPSCNPALPGRFISPTGLAVDGIGNLYVSETAGARVQKFPASGAAPVIWDLKGKGLGDLFLPGGLSVDQGGFVYLAEENNNVVIKFEPAGGAIVGRWGPAGTGLLPLHGPVGVGVDRGGNLYITDSGNWRVLKLAPDGSFLDQWRNCLDGDPPCQFPSGGDAPGQFMAPGSVATDGQGTVYVADTGNKRVQRLIVVAWNLIPPKP
jgi:DNA-binding beta-propeller fold protein YncE